MSLEHGLLPLPWGLWGVVILKDIVSAPFNYAEHNCYLKIMIGRIWGNDWHGEGVIAVKLLLTLKKGTLASNFKSNKPHLKLIRLPIPRLPQECRGLCQPWRHWYMLFGRFNTMATSQFRSDAFGEKKISRKGGPSCAPSLLTLKRELQISISKQTSLL